MIGEVAEMTGLDPYVLRYWETEFHQLRPRKDGAGRRCYSDRDVQMVRRIQFLLHVEKYTIEGARQVLQRPSKHRTNDLLELRAFLVQLQQRLEPPRKGE